MLSCRLRMLWNVSLRRILQVRFGDGAVCSRLVHFAQAADRLLIRISMSTWAAFFGLSSFFDAWLMKALFSSKYPGRNNGHPRFFHESTRQRSDDKAQFPNTCSIRP